MDPNQNKQTQPNSGNQGASQAPMPPKAPMPPQPPIPNSGGGQPLPANNVTPVAIQQRSLPGKPQPLPQPAQNGNVAAPSLPKPPTPPTSPQPPAPASNVAKPPVAPIPSLATPPQPNGGATPPPKPPVPPQPAAAPSTPPKPPVAPVAAPAKPPQAPPVVNSQPPVSKPPMAPLPNIGNTPATPTPVGNTAAPKPMVPPPMATPPQTNGGATPPPKPPVPPQPAAAPSVPPKPPVAPVAAPAKPPQAPPVVNSQPPVSKPPMAPLPNIGNPPQSSVPSGNTAAPKPMVPPPMAMPKPVTPNSPTATPPPTFTPAKTPQNVPPPPPPSPQMPGAPGAQTNVETPKQENPTLSKTQPPMEKTVKKGMGFKKILLVLIVLFMLIGGGLAAVVFFGNSSNNAAKKGSTDGTDIIPGRSVALTYWGLWEDRSVYEEVFDEFEAENPGVTINYELQSPQDYRERLSSAFARGEGPDIFRIHNTWVPMLRNQLSQLPDSVMSVSEYQSTFYPVIADDMQSDGGIVGMPLTIDGLGLYYNKAMFDTAGIQVPKTWEELRKAAKDLTISTEDEGFQRGGIALGLTNNVDHFSEIVALMLLQNGANPANPSNSLASDALNFYLVFSKTDTVWNAALPNSTTAFALEKTAMMIAPSWRAAEVKALNPDLDFAVAAIPQLPESEVAFASYWVESVSSGLENEDQVIAWKLLKKMSEAESLRKIHTKASQERLVGNPFPRVDMADQMLGDPYLGAYVEQAPYSQSWPMVGSTGDNGINDKIVKYYEDALNAVLTGNKLDEEVLGTVTQGVEQVLRAYGVSSQ